MVYDKMDCRSAVFFINILFPLNVLSQGVSNPQFSDYQVDVAQGSFEKNIHLSKEQESYSALWKKTCKNNYLSQ